ncbi:MAG: hypothetical protein AB7F21_05340 [Desulfuromonadales bacterium]
MGRIICQVKSTLEGQAFVTCVVQTSTPGLDQPIEFTLIAGFGFQFIRSDQIIEL